MPVSLIFWFIVLASVATNWQVIPKHQLQRCPNLQMVIN
jgi:hypothetical protein